MRARQLARTHLEAAGLRCRDREFDYSHWPGRWGPIVSAGAQLVMIVVAASMARNGDPVTALAYALIFLLALAVVSRWAHRRWTVIFPFQRTRGINLEASRGNPRVWLVAHIDSKSQTIPMLYRIASAGLLNLFTLGTLVALGFHSAGYEGLRGYWLLISLGAALAALPSLMCVVRNDSPGALDNASGVAAVLLAAARVPAERSLGVLITSAEELGLAGARAWSEMAAGDVRIINCDTIDDHGTWLCMHTGRRPELSRLAETTARRLGLKLRGRRLIPGILADSVPFADRGIEAVTLSRGSLSTLARIHTRGDNSTALTGDGVTKAAALLAALAMELA